MSDVREIVGAVAFEGGPQVSFRISKRELEMNTTAQLGSLLLARIDGARREAAEIVRRAQ